MCLSDEISHERSLRDVLVGHRHEIMQELQQPVGLCIFRAVLRNRPENALGVVSHHGELDEIGRIEEHVGIFLIRINPFHLGLADIRPVGDGLPG